MGALHWVLLSVLVVLVSPDPQSTHPLLEELVPVLKLASSIGKWVLSNSDLIDHMGPQIMREKLLLSNFAQLGKDIRDVEMTVHSRAAASLSTLLHQIPQSTRLELQLRDLSDLVSRVTTVELVVRRYAENLDAIERTTLESLAQWSISLNPEALPVLLERIHALVTPSGKGLLEHGILDLLTTTLQDSHSHLCSFQQSPHQLIYNMYNTIALAELKGYAMMQFSWMLLRMYNGQNNFTLSGSPASLVKHIFEERNNETLAAVKNALSGASRGVWRCDPRQHEEGKTFMTLTRLLQGYVENEVNLNKKGTCRHNCAYYDDTKYYGCYSEKLCSRQLQCKGKVRDCQYIDSDMWVCPASSPSHRRYNWIEYKNHKILGQKRPCTTETSKVNSWWRWLWHCSYCMCVCEAEDSHRYFSLWETLANTRKNRVITGIRFAKINNVFHLQISEGTLLPGGKVDLTSVEWSPVPSLEVADSDLVKGKDFHSMSYEERSVDLDNLEGPQGHVLTGVRFRKVRSHLNFAIRTTPFNFTTGKLISPKENSVWTNNVDNNTRTRLYLHELNVPTSDGEISVPDSYSHQFVEFSHSSLETDAGQSTVPYLDVQEVMPSSPVPLTGAGIYHKGSQHSAGFVALKVFTYDYARHMELGSTDVYNITTAY